MKKHKVPFTLVVDETYEHFLNNGVEKSFFRVMLAPLRAPLTFLQTLVRGHVPMTLSLQTIDFASRRIDYEKREDCRGTLLQGHR